MLEIIGGIFLRRIKDFFGAYGLKILALVALIAAFWGYGQYQYRAGYSAAKVECAQTQVSELKAAKAAETKALKEQKIALDKAYKAEIAKVEAENTVLANARVRAEAKANELNRQMTTYYHKLNEISKHVPLSTQSNDTPFTVGFVGLFNLATEGKRSSGADPISEAEIINAARLGEGSPTTSLSDPAKVSVEYLLDTVSYNAGIMNQCITERKQMQSFIKEVCALGVCDITEITQTPPEPIEALSSRDREISDDIGTSSIDVTMLTLN